MKNILKIIFTTLLLVNFSLKAQNLKHLIPKDAKFIAKIQSGKIQAKFSISQMNKLISIQDTYSSFAKELKGIDIEQLGIDLNKNSYFFFNDKSFSGWFLPVNNFPKLEQVISSHMPNVAVQDFGDFHLGESHNKNDFIAYSSKFIFIGRNENSENLSSDFSKLLKNRNKTKYFSNCKADASLWFDSSLFKDLNSFFPSYRDQFTTEIYSKMVYDGQQVANLFFLEDKILFEFEYKASPKIKKSYKAVFNSKFNRDLYHYIPENNIAFSTLHFNTEAYLNHYPNFLTHFYGPILGLNESENESIRELLSLFIDEKDMADLFEGSALFSLNKIQKQETSYTSYNYDEDFNKREVVKTRMTDAPIFNLAISTKKSKLLNSLLNLSFRKAKEYKQEAPFVRKKINNKYVYYSTDQQMNEFGVLAFIVTDNALIITNDTESLENLFFQKTVLLTKKSRRLIAQNNSLFKLNVSQLIQNIPSSYINSTKESIRISNLLQKNIKDLVFKSYFKNNKLVSSIEISKPKNTKNSLEHFFLVLDDIYKILETPELYIQ